MEYVHTTLVQLAASRVSEADPLFHELEAHRDAASAMRGYQGMRINRTTHPEGDILVVVETRWSSNNAMVDYAAAKENAATVIGKYESLAVPGSLQTHRMESLAGERAEAPNRMYDRLALALFVPVGVLAFALISIFFLSRIYLSLPAAAASIMAITVAILILAASAYFASSATIPRWQWLGAAIVGFAALAIGGTVAGVYDEENKEVHAPDNGGEPTPGPGGPLVIQAEDNFFAQPDISIPTGPVEIPIENLGTAIHNMHVAVTGAYEGEGVCVRGAAGCSEPNQIRGGQSGVITLDLEPGTYDYRCDFHIAEQMFGTITVDSNAPPIDGAGGPGGEAPAE
jgi:heme-degrading monooxygenase HmoA